jgi:CDP-glucose 4,6-dehydratase
MAVAELDPEFWRDRRVLVTGHTGFKGSWLVLWLESLGARIFGVSAGPIGDPSLYRAARVPESLAEEAVADVRDYAAVGSALERIGPEIVIHMAAQPLVRRSFAEPRETFEINVMGTVNVLEAVRVSSGVRVALVVTSDKCYENREWEWGYRETEPMGGYDPYSSSKGAAELVTAAFRRSFFTGEDRVRLASARAGNAIGGGDWGADRLIPDIARAVADGQALHVRNPDAVRPWQHVLNPLYGYLLLAQELWDKPDLAYAWNFGPAEEDARSVGWVVEQVRQRWQGQPDWTHDEGGNEHEARYLKLDSSRARWHLGWRPVIALDQALDSTVDWYRSFTSGADMREVTRAQIAQLVGSGDST